MMERRKIRRIYSFKKKATIYGSLSLVNFVILIIIPVLITSVISASASSFTEGSRVRTSLKVGSSSYPSSYRSITSNTNSNSNTYKTTHTYKITSKPCVINSNSSYEVLRGTCMFVWECIKSEGKHLGMCIDGFMFGSCCSHNDTHNVINSDSDNSMKTSTSTSASTEPLPNLPFVTSNLNNSVFTTSTSASTSSTSSTSLPWTTDTDFFGFQETSGFPEISDTESTEDIFTIRPITEKWTLRPRPTIMTPKPSSVTSFVTFTDYDPPTTTAITTTTKATTTTTTATTTTTSTTTTTTEEPPIPETDTPPTTTPRIKPELPNDECGVAPLVPQKRIVGGKESSFGSWPWIVSVRRTSFFGFSSTHRCGGTLINENWVITAGHCVDDLLISQIRIRIGEWDFSVKGGDGSGDSGSGTDEKYQHIERGVLRKVVHGSYNFFTYENDLALLYLDGGSIKYSQHVRPLCLQGNKDLLVGHNATVAGWGRLSEGGILPNRLQQVNVPIMSNEECRKLFLKSGRVEHIPDIFLCAGYPNGGRDSCQGDSGGPLQVKGSNGRWFLAGIISWGIGCAEPNMPGVCTRISKFTEWILKHVT